MSSGDELGGYEPTTPGPAQAQKKPAPRPRPVPRAVAGPSSKPQKPPAAKKTAQKEVETIEIDKSPDITMISSDEEEPPQARRTATANKSKDKGTQNANTHVNGVANGKTKGKTKARQPAAASGDAMEVDDAEVVHSDPIPAVRPSKSRSNSKASPSVVTPMAARRENRELDALKRENERLRHRLDDANKHNTELEGQLQSLMKIRHTEPEQLLEERIEEFDASTRAQERLLEEQRTQLAHFKILADTGRLGEIPFLSREQADAEKRSLENKVKVLNESVRSKDVKIKELQEENKDLRFQLEEEIKMAKAQKPNPPDRTRTTNVKSDPKTNEVIELYERLSNLSVLNVRRGKFHSFNLPKTTYTCLYTHSDDPSGDPSADEPKIVLSFDLEDTWARKEDGATDAVVSSQEELEAKTMYIPRDLDKQPPETVKRLDFFKDQFLFTPSQLSVFHRTLADRLSKTAPSVGNSQETPVNESGDSPRNQGQHQTHEDVVEVMIVDNPGQK
ncbi:hypothetical protein NM688_g5330 [Phlebia brevispora]|uniref:Uncharacterized protein n=1 Tax=Phlebia brevispora TaxID=194682 RepID=A0ACC1SX46_9APHY|nr:hypothetical protein NM688_g5330 [Phlebia brevispora]